MNKEAMIDIVKEVTVLCKSNKSRFTEDLRLKKIHKLLKTSPFVNIYKGKLTRLYAQIPIEDMKGDILVISTHADFVPNKAYAEYDEKHNILQGTFDNSITNAVACILMKGYELPKT